MTRPVRISLFATAREAVGKGTIDMPVPTEGLPIRSLLMMLVGRHRALGPVLPDCRVARNGRYISLRTSRVRPGDEVAIHPPYSGG